jgi:hypothetical protein
VLASFVKVYAVFNGSNALKATFISVISVLLKISGQAGVSHVKKTPYLRQRFILAADRN